MFGEDGEYDPRDDPINKYMESAGTMVNVAIESADLVLNRYFGGCNVFGSNSSRQDDPSRSRVGRQIGTGRARGGESSLLDTTQKAINERYNANGNEPLPLPEGDLDTLADLKFVRIEYSDLSLGGPLRCQVDSLVSAEIRGSDKTDFDDAMSSFSYYMMNEFDGKLQPKPGKSIPSIGLPNEVMNVICRLFAKRVVVWGNKKATIANRLINRPVNGFDWLEKNKKVAIPDNSIRMYFLSSITDRLVSPQPCHQNLLFILHVLSLLMRSRHNRAYILHRFGANFALMVVEVLRSISVIFDDVVTKLMATDEASNITSSQYKYRFLLSVSTALAQICSCIVQLPDVSKNGDFCGNYDSNPFPMQPFNVKFFSKQLGVDLFLGTMRPITEAVSANKDSSSIEAALGNTLAYEALSISFSYELIQSGAVVIGLSLLKRLSSMCRELLRKFIASEKYLLNYAGTRKFEQMRKNVSGLRSDWVWALTAQSDILVFVISAMMTQTTITLKSFNKCDGCKIINDVLSMKDIPKTDSFKINQLERNLVVHRSFQCMRLFETAHRLAQNMSYTSLVNNIVDSLEGFSHFASWLSRSMLDEESGSSESIRYRGGLSCRNISCASPMHVPYTDTILMSDIGTWPSAIAELNFSKKDESKGYLRSDLDMFTYPVDALNQSHDQYYFTAYFQRQIIERSETDEGSLASNAVMLTWMEEIDKWRAEPSIYQPNNQRMTALPPWLTATPFSMICLAYFDLLFQFAWANYDTGRSNNADMKTDVDPADGIQDDRHRSLRTILQSHATALLGGASAAPTRYPVFQVFFMYFLGKCIVHDLQASVTLFRESGIWRMLFQSPLFFLNGKKNMATILNVNNKRTTLPRLQSRASEEQVKLEDTFTSIFDAIKINCHGAGWFTVTRSNTLPQERANDGDAVPFINDDRPRESLSTADKIAFLDDFFSRKLVDSGSSVQDQSNKQHRQSLGGPIGQGVSRSMFPTEDSHNLGIGYLFLQDMIMDLLSNVIISMESGGIYAGRFPELEDVAGALSMRISHDGTIQIARWLSYFIKFLKRTKTEGNIEVKWHSIMRHLSNVCKSHAMTMGPSDHTGKLDCAAIQNNTPFFWPAQASVLHAMECLMISPFARGWIRAFLPRPAVGGEIKGRTDQKGKRRNEARLSFGMQEYNDRQTLFEFEAQNERRNHIGAATKPVKVASTLQHLSLFRMVLYPRCRDVAIYMLIRLLQECAIEVFKTEYTRHSAERYSAASAFQMTSSSLPEALAHDIIRGMCKLLKTAPRQPLYTESYNAAIACIKALERVSSSCKNMIVENDFERILWEYGPITPCHRLYLWDSSRPRIAKDLTISAQESLRISEGEWTPWMKSAVLTETSITLGELCPDSRAQDELVESFKEDNYNLGLIAYHRHLMKKHGDRFSGFTSPLSLPLTVLAIILAIALGLFTSYRTYNHNFVGNILYYLYYFSLVFRYFPQIALSANRRSTTGLSNSAVCWYLLSNTCLWLGTLPINGLASLSANDLSEEGFDLFYSINGFLCLAIVLFQCWYYGNWRGSYVLGLAFAMFTLVIAAYVGALFIFGQYQDVILAAFVYVYQLTSILRFLPQIKSNYDYYSFVGVDLCSLLLEIVGYVALLLYLVDAGQFSPCFTAVDAAGCLETFFVGTTSISVVLLTLVLDYILLYQYFFYHHQLPADRYRDYKSPFMRIGDRDSDASFESIRDVEEYSDGGEDVDINPADHMWTCRNCVYVNSIINVSCEMCDTPKELATAAMKNSGTASANAGRGAVGSAYVNSTAFGHSRPQHQQDVRRIAPSQLHL